MLNALLIITNTILIFMLAVFMNMVRQRNQVISSLLESFQKKSGKLGSSEQQLFDYETEESFQEIIKKLDFE